MVAASFFNKLHNIFWPDVSSGQYFDLLTRVLNQGSQSRRAVQCRDRLPTGKHSSKAEFDQLIERGKWIWKKIKGTMEDGSPSGNLYNLFTPWTINSYLSQRATNNSRGSFLHKLRGIAEHDIEFTIGIVESTWPRADENKDRN